MKIGVFDSGIGGKSIAERLERDYPEHEVLYVSDSEHVPYGNRSNEEVIQLTERAIQPLLAARCDVIVLACNTATAAAIEYLRQNYPHAPFVGLEPMVKPATEQTNTGVVAICATPSTLRSERYLALKEKYAQGIKVIEPDCSQWAYMIEHNQVQHDHIADTINIVLAKQADVIVLACTHYHWIKEEIARLATGKAEVIDTSEAISRRVGVVLSQVTRSDK